MLVQYGICNSVFCTIFWVLIIKKFVLPEDSVSPVSHANTELAIQLNPTSTPFSQTFYENYYIHKTIQLKKIKIFIKI